MGRTDGQDGADKRTGTSKSDKGEKSVKKSREFMRGKAKKQYTVEEKKAIIKLIEEGAKTCDIVRQLNVPESSVRNMRKRKDEIKATLKVTEKFFCGGVGGARRAMHSTTENNRLLVMTEHYVMKWLARRLKENVSVDGPEIRGQAVKIYKALCVKKGVSNPALFTASRGWLHRFRKRCDVKLAYYHGEVASADASAAIDYPKVARELIEEGGYTLEQIFNCDETGVNWKKSPKSTYVPKGHRQAAGTKIAKDKFTVLLTTNVTGDFMMKPVILYKYAKPHSFRNCDMNNLPNCVWYNNQSGYMNSDIALKWFDERFVPGTRDYCKRKNLAFKVLLFMDNAPGHPKYLAGRHPAVQVVFLPPNTTSKLQPLDQELIANVKLLFYGMLHKTMREMTDSQVELRQIEEGGSSNSEPEPDEIEPAEMSVKAFWHQFKIKQAVDYVCAAWRKITVATVKHAWHPLLPHLDLTQADRQQQEVLARETTALVRAAPGMSSVSQSDVEELILTSDSEQTIEDMMNQDEEREDGEGIQDRDEPQLGEPTTSEYSELLGLLGVFEGKINNLRFDTRDDAMELLKKLTSVVNKKFNDKINARQQSLITSYMRKENARREAARRAVVNDTDDPDTLPVFDTDEEVDFEGFDDEVIEAMRIDEEARKRGAGIESE